MPTLSEQERQKYEKMWDVPSYRHVSPGYVCISAFLDHFAKDINEGQSVTDFGCGMGLTTLPFLEKGLTVQLIDIARNCLEDKIALLQLFAPDRISFIEASLWNLPSTVTPTDWIYCTDVLEHIPTQKVDLCLSQMARKCRKGGMLQVFLIDEPFGRLIDEQLHLTIKPLSWWQQKIGKYFHIDGIAHIIPNIRISFFVRSLTD